jgi:hypothetical protein
MALLQKGYLGATPLFKEKSWFEDMSQVPINDSGDITVTADTAAHTKGAWVELVASTSANASFLIVEVAGIVSSGVDTATLVDIGTGASGAETAIIPDVAVGSANNSNASLCTLTFSVPIKVASGTRLSARIQSLVTGGKTATVRVFTFDMGDYAYAPTAVDVIGTSTATSAGTAMSGASGTWVQITASTANAYKAVVMVPSASAGAIGNIRVEYRLGTGASGSEISRGSIFATYNASEAVGLLARTSSLITAAIPSGTRLSVRHDIPSSPSVYDMTLIGIR